MASSSLSDFIAWLDSQAYRDHFARILADIADEDLARGHVGSYG